MGSASLGGGEKGGVRRVELEAQGRRTVSGKEIRIGCKGRKLKCPLAKKIASMRQTRNLASKTMYMRVSEPSFGFTPKSFPSRPILLLSHKNRKTIVILRAGKFAVSARDMSLLCGMGGWWAGPHK
jgi:hypothetical protein